jgi:hypothetical protein
MRNLLLLICLVALPAWGQDYNVPFSPPVGGDAIADNCTIVVDFHADYAKCGAVLCGSGDQDVLVDSVGAPGTGTLDTMWDTDTGAGKVSFNYQDSRLNNEHSVSFTTSSARARDNDNVALTQPYTVYAAVYDSLGGYNNRWVFADNTNGAEMGVASTANLTISDGTTTLTDVDDDHAVAGSAILTFVHNGASSEAWWNGNMDISGDAGSTAFNDLIVGNYSASSQGWRGQISRIIVCSGAHDTNAKDAIQDQLGTTYGVAGLPD